MYRQKRSEFNYQGRIRSLRRSIRANKLHIASRGGFMPPAPTGQPGGAPPRGSKGAPATPEQIVPEPCDFQKLEAQLAAIETMPSKQLREEWSRFAGSPPPRIPPKLLRMALAWELQAKALVGLSRTTQSKLAQIAASKSRTAAVSPGMRLFREWQGRMHVATIGEDKVIRWEDREYRSLSEVAKAITGTHWSGPAFFGLRKKLAA